MKTATLKLYTFQAENDKWPVCESVLCRDCMLRTVSWYNDTIDPYVDQADRDTCEECGVKEGDEI